MSGFFVHPSGICESSNIGQGSRIWAFAHVLPGAIIGRDCNVCDGVFIENDVQIGDRVTVKCGVQIWDGVRIEDDVFLGPNATFTNNLFPRSKIWPKENLRTWIRQGATVGANATILPGIEVGTLAMVGAGAVVTRSVPPYAIAVGNPATIVGYVDSTSGSSVQTEAAQERAASDAALMGTASAKIEELQVLSLLVLLSFLALPVQKHKY